jgi:hypothetical protein
MTKTVRYLVQLIAAILITGGGITIICFMVFWYHPAGCKQGGGIFLGKWAWNSLNLKNEEPYLHSIAGIMAAMRSGLAVAPVGRHVVPDDARIIGPSEGFLPLPVAGVCLRRAASARDVTIHKLAAHVRNSFMAT